MGSVSDAVRFIREFVRDPLHTAAVAPSSPDLAAAMVAPISPGSVVLELGPGTGAFTRAIAARAPARHVAVELHAEWAELLAARHPGVEVRHGDVRALDPLLDAHGVGRVDAVVSGLPWVAYRPSGTHRPLLDVIADRLTGEGTFTQFAYTWSRWAPPARRLHAGMRARFADVTTTATVWRNVPPAVVHTCRLPRGN